MGNRKRESILLDTRRLPFSCANSYTNFIPKYLKDDFYLCCFWHAGISCLDYCNSSQLISQLLAYQRCVLHILGARILLKEKTDHVISLHTISNCTQNKNLSPSHGPQALHDTVRPTFSHQLWWHSIWRSPCSCRTYFVIVPSSFFFL